MKLFDICHNKSGLCVFFILFSFIVISYIMYGFFNLTDDTYIYLQYAKNILNHGEFSFNASEISNGITSPLWLLFLLITKVIFGNNLIFPALMSLIFALAYIHLWHKILLNLNITTVNIYLILFIICLDPNLMKHTFNGMETTSVYFGMLFLIWVVFLNIPKHYILIGFLEGTLFLLRPDFIIILIISNLFLLIKKKASLKDLILIILGGTIIILPWWFFSYQYFGRILPDTFYAKGADYPIGKFFSKNIIDSILIFFGSYFPIIFSIVFLKLKRRKKNQLSLFIVLVIFCYILFYSLIISNEFIFSRYYIIVFPLLFLFILLIIQENIYYPNKIILGGMIIYFLSISLVHSYIYRHIYTQSETVEDSIIEWIKKNTTKNDHIFRDRIGKIGYYSNRYIVDPVGLINPEISKYKLNGDYVKYLKIKKTTVIIDPKPNEYSLLKDNLVLVDSIQTRQGFLVRQEIFKFFENKDQVKKIYCRIYRTKW